MMKIDESSNRRSSRTYKNDNKNVKFGNSAEKMRKSKQDRLVLLDNKIINLTQKLSKNMNYRFAIDTAEI